MINAIHPSEGVCSMEFSRFEGMQVIDCHVHPWPPWKSDARLDESALKAKLGELKEAIGVSRLAMMNVYGNPDHAALYLKAANPERFYSGGYAPWSFEARDWRDTKWDEYVANLVALGYDGIGEMGTKTVTRDRHTPLDSSIYEGFWAACEDHHLAVDCHIGDPEDFWYEDKTPDWAKARGWGYYKGDYPTLEELYGEVENVLTRHPKANIVFPHLLFLSPHMERLSELFKRHRGAHVDLAPGVELIYNISRRRDDWRAFFTRHADRILLGTDIGMSKSVEQHAARVWMLRMFLEGDEDFFTPKEADDLLTRYELPFAGLALPRAALEKIYSGNFLRLYGKKPRTVDVAEAARVASKSGQEGVAKAFKAIR
jgi:predicted TIM-barrel fold metal-dependent hydrolase